MFYWPKCLDLLRDPGILEEYRSAPRENFHFKAGPWLKRQVASRLVPEVHVTVTDVSRTGRRTHITVEVENAADIPVFPVCLSVMDSGVRDVAEDNFFWLDPGEKRTLRMVADSLPGAGKTMTLKVSAWNCPEQSIRFSEDEEV